MDRKYDNELQCIKQSIKVIKDNIFYFIGSYAIIILKSILTILISIVIIDCALKCFRGGPFLWTVGFISLPICFIYFLKKIESYLWQFNTVNPLLYEIIKD